MGITSARLKELELIDQVVPEPLGGAHCDHKATAAALREVICEQLTQLTPLLYDDLIARRSERLRQFGEYKES